MHRIKHFSVIVFVTLLSAIIMGMGSPSPLASNSSTKSLMIHGSIVNLRGNAVKVALAKNDIFDCETFNPPAKLKVPLQRQLFTITKDIKITPDDGNDYLGAVWSPQGDSMIFTVPSNSRREITDHDTLPSDIPSRLLAVSVNKLLAYYEDHNLWQEITTDGANPTWSKDGTNLYYMAGGELMRYDIDTQTNNKTNLSTPTTGAGLLFSRPLLDGNLLAPSAAHAPLEVKGKNATQFPSITLAEGDRLLLSPSGNDLIVAYGSNIYKGQLTPAVTILYRLNGESIPLLKNCQSSAMEMAWSPTGDKIAYPVRAERPEIRVYDLNSGRTRVLARFDALAHLGGLSWSPDGKYLAFSSTKDTSTIWVLSGDGNAQQELVQDGLMPNWSPNGRQILYARMGAKQRLDWHVLGVDSITGAIGEQSK